MENDYFWTDLSEDIIPILEDILNDLKKIEEVLRREGKDVRSLREISPYDKRRHDML